jgi:uncharacterized protein with FMN-binding domain
MGSTKFFVIRLKEILYTALFIVVGILLILLLVFMFSDKQAETTPTMQYIPGVYTTSVLLDNQPINVEVIVDSDHINSITIKDLNPSTQVLYPLLEPAMETIESQLTTNIELTNVQIESEYEYTSALLLEAIHKAIDKAKVSDKEDNN